MKCICFASLLLASILSTTTTYSDEANNKNKLNSIDKVILSESKVRYYIYYDLRGNSPSGLGSERLTGDIRAGDEIIVRFYPNLMLSFDSIDLPDIKKVNENRSAILFPYDYSESDIYSIQSGYGAVYFATKEKGKFRLRIAANTSSCKIDGKLPLKEIHSEFLKDVSARELKDFSKALSRKLDDEWDVWVFENVLFHEGEYTIEVFQTGVNAYLRGRIKKLKIMNIFQNIKLYHKRDLAAPEWLPMEGGTNSVGFETMLTGEKTVIGVHHINLHYDLSKNSWQYKQREPDVLNVPLKYIPDQIVIERARDLPGKVRVRAGFGIFDRASHVTLVTNFVLILYPKEYFSKSTPFLKRFNPTVGIQIGSTGDQDFVPLLGFSFKLIEQADWIIGLRFGLEPEIPWKLDENLYFGATLDPGLFNRLRESR